MLGYLPPSLWTQLFACNNWVESQDLLITFLQSLGGRSLTEPTFKCMASLSLMATDPKHAKMLPCNVKQRAYQALKAMFKIWRSHWPSPMCGFSNFIKHHL